jgi:hypothetical protein
MKSSCLGNVVSSSRGSTVVETKMTFGLSGWTALSPVKSPRLVELYEEVAKVVEELDHARVRDRKRTGMPCANTERTPAEPG